MSELLRRARGALASGLLGFAERPRWQRVVALSTGAIVALGLVLRARGYLFGTHALWLDEAYWATKLMHEPLIELLIRPIGFMALSKLLAVSLGPSEAVLRFLPWVAALATALVAAPLGRRLYASSAAQLLFVAVIALHPGAIDLAKEFKPYAVSILAHVLLLYLVLRYLDTHSPRDLAVTLLVANAGIFFTQDLVFAYPGLFLVLGWEVYRADRARTSWVVLAAVTLFLALGAQYFFIWRHLSSNETAYWDRRDDVYFQPNHGQSYLAWWLDRYAGVAELPGLRRRNWNAAWLPGGLLKGISRADELVWLVVHLVGVARLLVTRRWRLLTLLMLPLAVQWAFNSLHLWPMGVFRTNGF